MDQLRAKDGLKEDYFKIKVGATKTIREGTSFRKKMNGDRIAESDVRRMLLKTRTKATRAQEESD